MATLGSLMDPIVAWVVALMLSWAPPGKSKIEHARETAEAGRARYEEIARAATSVCYDAQTPPLFFGKRGRAQTVALLLSVAYHESGFRRDVDLGLGPLARGSGTDSCLMQLRVGKGTTAEGWSHDDLIRDRRMCFRAGLALLRRSLGACRHLGTLDGLSAYASGRCVAGSATSRALVGPALRARAAPLLDAEVLAALEAPRE